MFRMLSIASALTVTLSGAGFAARLVTTGTGVIAVHNTSETAPNTLSAGATTGFAQIPGAARSFRVNSASDLFTVTFSAETQCRDTSGAATGLCAVRIVASQGSRVVPFHPRNSGNPLDAAFDANPTGLSNAEEWESHSLTQSLRLPAGLWTIRAQWAVAVTAGSTSFRLDDWNLRIVISD